MHRTSAVLAVFALGLALAGTAAAQLRPVPQTVLSRGAIGRGRPAPIGRSLHNVFGTIVSFASPRLVLRTRNGRLLIVDATTALRLGTYSAPLFPGKLVLVGGSFDTVRVLHATTITRMTRIDNATPGDT